MRRLATEGVYSLKDHEELPVVLLSPQASRRGKQPTGMNPSSRASASVDCPIVISIPSSPVEVGVLLVPTLTSQTTPIVPKILHTLRSGQCNLHLSCRFSLSHRLCISIVNGWIDPSLTTPPRCLA